MADNTQTRPKPIASLWTQCHERIISPTAPAVQFNHMRLAFFSGAFSVFEFMKAVSHLSDQDRERMLAHAQNELDEWRGQMSGGR